MMTDLLPHASSAETKNSSLNLFRVPPTDLSISSHCMVPIQTFTTGINPVEFQVDPQEDYVDLSRSYFEVELALKKAAGGNLLVSENLFPVNNPADTLFKQIIISPQTDTYH